MNLAEFIYTVLLAPPPLRRFANRILRAITPASVSVRGATVHLNPNDPVVSAALALSCYEKDEIEFFLARFESGMTLVDVGANVGLYTGLALRRASAGTRILCVEPSRESLCFLENTIASNTAGASQSAVSVFPKAASDSKRSLILYKNSSNKGDNRIYSDPLCDESEAIEADTLDNMCAQAGIPSIDFLKIDVQGAEYKVLSGARSILSQSADCVLMTEFWPYGISRCGDSPLRYLTLLQELGFTLYELRARRLTPVSNFDHIISRNSGRLYRNLIGLKGRHR